MFTAVIRRSRLTLSPFSSEQMMTIGDVVLSSVTDRIRSAMDVTDSPAPPLSPAYARRKQLRNRAPVRDWVWRGATLRSVKVKSASEDRVTLGPVTTEADMILTVNNRRRKQWGVSPKDNEVLHAVILATLRQPGVIQGVRPGVHAGGNVLGAVAGAA